MELHREDESKAPQTSAERKPKRFRIVKLEERIAPSNGNWSVHRCPTNDHICNTVPGACRRY
jgi:hypothetical protein